MPDRLNITYIVGFPVSGSSGKNKATREKARVLKDKSSSDKFVFLCPKRSMGLFGKFAEAVFFDFYCSYKLIFKSSDFIVIQRVFFLPLTRFTLFIKRVIVISEFHADLGDELPFLNKGRFTKKLLELSVMFFRLNFKLSDGIIFNHPVLKERFESKFRKPSIFSYNGSNHKEFFPEDTALARSTLSIDCNETMFLFIGSVSQWHGVDYLIEIFNQQIIRNRKDFHLYIVGAKENQYTKGLQEAVKSENIHFIPEVTIEVARSYINASDYCLLPAKEVRISPGSPLKLYDYIACGKPVITQSNLRGYSDEVERYKLGYTVDFRDAAGCASNLLEIVYSSVRFLENNRRVAVEEVSWEKRIDDWLEFSSTFSAKKN